MDGGPTIIGACHLASDLKKCCWRHVQANTQKEGTLMV
jgi:hypothetical protein